MKASIELVEYKAAWEKYEVDCEAALENYKAVCKTAWENYEVALEKHVAAQKATREGE